MMIVESHEVSNCHLFSHPTCEYRSLLIAVGIIVFIGTLIATGFLYSEMGYTSFAIGGSGAVFFVVCLAISHCSGHYSTSIETSDSPLPTKWKEGVSTFNRIPCPRSGMSCFANTAIQILAHIVPFRELFDSSLNQLSKRASETDQEFKIRQQIQKQGLMLINKILQGKSVEKEAFKEFINSVIKSSKGHTYNLYLGGDARNFISDSLNALHTQQKKGVPPFLSSVPIRWSQTIKSSMERNSWTTLPKTLRLTNDCKSNYIPEITIEDIGTYQLKAVILSSTFDSNKDNKDTHKFGHATPLLRTEEGELYQVDDLKKKTIQMTEDQLSTIFSSGRGWTAAYYVLKE